MFQNNPVADHHHSKLKSHPKFGQSQMTEVVFARKHLIIFPLVSVNTDQKESDVYICNVIYIYNEKIYIICQYFCGCSSCTSDLIVVA